MLPLEGAEHGVSNELLTGDPRGLFVPAGAEPKFRL
jgi:hypothetical protein